MKVLLLLLASALVTSCAALGHHSLGSGSKVWSSSELNSRKQEMDGVEVLVDAYLVHEPENYSLWDNKQAMSKGDSGSCISLIYPEPLAGDIRQSNRKQVRLRGTFLRDVTADGGVYLGLCNYTGLRVAEILR